MTERDVGRAVPDGRPIWKIITVSGAALVAFAAWRGGPTITAPLLAAGLIGLQLALIEVERRNRVQRPVRATTGSSGCRHSRR
jgi:hypothetical protein